jgi:hypothetical protein
MMGRETPSSRGKHSAGAESAHTFLGHFGGLRGRDSKRGMETCRDGFQVIGVCEEELWDLDSIT